jgi:DNA (cytosine-5)-methyltransferase 1
MSKTDNRKPKFVDLFAGCGGLSLGLEMAGFEPIFVNELNPHALETYLMNRDRDYPLLRQKFNIQDVKELVANKGALLDQLSESFKSDFDVDTKLGELDLVVGGPPCQGYSGMGHRRSYAVNKSELPSNHLYRDMATVIKKLRPKLFLFENVKGLQTARWSFNGQKGEIWEDVQSTFKSLVGYRVHPQLVHAKNYGVPQNRPRLLVVGVREDISFKLDKNSFAMGFLPEPRNDYLNLNELLGDLVDDTYVNGGQTYSYACSPKNSVQKWFRSNPINGRTLGKGAQVTEHKYSNHSAEVVKKFKYMLENDGVIPPGMQTKKFSQRVLPATWGANGPSITATSLPDDYVHFCQPRTLTVREWARLQTFPDWYQFSGKRTTGGIRRAGNPREGLFDREVPKYTQIGNAVPVKLAEAIGRHFLRILGETT